jgi:hypothetical protein
MWERALVALPSQSSAYAALANGGSIPPTTKFVIHANSQQANIAIVEIDRITSEWGASEWGARYRYAPVLQPDKVVFDSS